MRQGLQLYFTHLCYSGQGITSFEASALYVNWKTELDQMSSLYVYGALGVYSVRWRTQGQGSNSPTLIISVKGSTVTCHVYQNIRLLEDQNTIN